MPVGRVTAVPFACVTTVAGPALPDAGALPGVDPFDMPLLIPPAGPTSEDGLVWWLDDDVP